MKFIFTCICLVATALSCLNAQTYVVPTAYTSAISGGTFLGPLVSSARTYQLLMNENQLTGLVGKKLNGISFRLLPSATVAWPAADISYSSYDIYLSTSVAPASRSLTMTDNIVGEQIQVRSGALAIRAASFPSGGSPNNFGTVISFNNTYTYTGGHLLLEIRENGSTGASVSVESALTSNSNYGVNFSACWTGTYTGVTGMAGNFAVTQFTYTETLPLSLLTFKAVRRMQDADLHWSTATEQNTKSFLVEKSVDNRVFSGIGNIVAAGNTVTTRQYSFTDSNIVKPVIGILYYRLKMLDRDGGFTYSPTAIIRFGQAATITIYPNPVKSILNVAAGVASEEKINYAVINMEGKILRSGQYVFKAGTNNMAIDIKTISAGRYYLSINGVVTQRKISFIKQ